MLVIVAVFDRQDLNKPFRLKGKALVHMASVFPDYPDKLNAVTEAVAYMAGREHADEPVWSLAVKSRESAPDEISISTGDATPLDIKSGAVSDEMYRLAKRNGWLSEAGYAPSFCFMEQAEFDDLRTRIQLCERMDMLMQAGDYKAVCMLCAPLKAAKDNAGIWNSADVLYRLGRACSKQATTLLVKAGETKKLGNMRQYRELCAQFLQRGAELEPDSARCATALAYRYYSNVHELMRPGERCDQDLEQEIEKANEWLSRAIEIYPQSVRNHYRKGKLIIEKQAPYLLFGKRAYGTREAELLREIREVGEEHLATAVTLFEALEDAAAKERDRREYAKALFVLGGYYLDDAYLPVLEYFLRQIAGCGGTVPIAAISRLDLQSAIELLEKSFYAETDMPLQKLDIAALCEKHSEWTRSPVEKLYRLGCAHSAMAFAHLAEGREEALQMHAANALKYLQAAKNVADKSQDRKRNTWHISEKIAWTYIYLGQYDRAAKLLQRARAGYISNTYAIALLLMNNAQSQEKAKEALASAVNDAYNLASGLSWVLLSYVCVRCGESQAPVDKALSSRNRRLAGILGLAGAEV